MKSNMFWHYAPGLLAQWIKMCYPSLVMKKGIHPEYYPKAQVRCACGNTFTVGATQPNIEIEICSKCHPFFTGKEKLVDTAGRVEKFKARLAKKEALEAKRSKTRH
jgi:large subunit ribosomal protein L31